MRRVYIGKFNHHVRERDIERFFRQEGKIREVLMKEGFAFVEFEHTTDAEAAVKHLDGRDLDGDRVHVEFAKGPPRTPRDGMRGGAMGMGGRGLSRRDGPPRRDFRNDRAGSGRERGDRDDSRSGMRSGGGSASGGISYAEKYGPPRNTDYRVIVENLSSRVSWQDLKDLMRQAGEVTFADAHKRERNMGIVDFATVKDMRHAIDTLNDTDFHGRRIKVYEDKSRRRSGPGGGSSGSGRDFGGRRSGGRSRSRSPRRYSSSRSRSRDRQVSRSRSPVARNRDAPSRSRSVSTSPVARRKPQRSRSRSRSRDSPQSERPRSRSRSVSRSRSRSRSASPAESPVQRKTRSRSRSASSSRSHNSGADDARTNHNNNNNDDSNKLSGGDYDRRRSESRSRSRSASRSPQPNSKKARLSASPNSPASEHAED